MNLNEFNWLEYITKYEDLRKAGINTKRKAYYHWITHGQKEGRMGCIKKLITNDITNNMTNNITNNTNDKLNIIYCVGETCDKKYNTGIQRVVRLLAKYLNNECNLQLVKFDYKTNSFIDLSNDEKINMENYSGISINNIFKLTVPNKWLIMPEVIIRPVEKSILPIFNEARRNKMKIASIFYDDIPYKLHHLYPKSVLELFMIHINTLLTSDLILPISHYAYSRLLTHCNKVNCEENDIYSKILPCCLPGEFSNYARNFVYRPITDRYIILCISTIEPRKNQITLIKAIEILQNKYNIELILVGMVNNDSYYNEISKLINSNKNIKHYPIINDEELKNLYLDCTMSVYPSIEEGFGLPILESIWNCKPCICMNYGSMAEIAIAGCLKIDCNNVDKIVNAIDEIISDNDIRNKLIDEIKNVKLKSWNTYAFDIISYIKLFNTEFNLINYSYNNIYNKIIDENLLNKYITIHNKKPFLGVLVSSTKISDIKIGLDITPIYHQSYMNRGIGFLVKNYFDILSNIPDIKLIPLSKNSHDEAFDIIHFTCPPVINDIWDDEICKEIKLIRDRCLKKRNSKIYIMTVYDLIPHIFKNVYKPSQIYYDFIDLLKQMDLIIAISNSTKNDLVTIFNLPQEKIYVIYPALRNNFYQITDKNEIIRGDIILRKYKITKKFILYTGGIDFRKNIDKTIQGYAFAKNSYGIDIQLVIVCAISTEYKNIYLNLINELKLQPNDVIFTNFISDSDLNILYNKAYVSIFVSLYEGFGMPIIEAINCKIPIIVSNTSSMFELMELSSNNLLFADPYDIQSIARSIKYIFDVDINGYNSFANNSSDILPLFNEAMVKMELMNAYKYALVRNYKS